MEDTQEQTKNSKPWLFQKGVSGNPGGRPKGTKSLKAWAREYLETLSDDEKLNFVEGLPKDVIWKMGEGNPHQTEETTLDATINIVAPTPVIDKLNESNEETDGSNKE